MDLLLVVFLHRRQYRSGHLELVSRDRLPALMPLPYPGKKYTDRDT